MNGLKYIKSFSKGQITIPKEFREALNLEGDFWLKLSLTGKKITAEPAEKAKRPKAKTNYREKLLKIKGGWFSEKEWLKTRKEVEERLKLNSND